MDVLQESDDPTPAVMAAPGWLLDAWPTTDATAALPLAPGCGGAAGTYGEASNPGDHAEHAVVLVVRPGSLVVVDDGSIDLLARL